MGIILIRDVINLARKIIKVYEMDYEWEWEGKAFFNPIKEACFIVSRLCLAYILFPRSFCLILAMHVCDEIIG